MAKAGPCHTTTVSVSSRRSFIRAVAAAPLAAIPALASPDDELIGLAGNLLALMPGYRAALTAANDLDDEYARRAPKKPRALLWRLGDPVPYRDPVFGEDGKRYLCCDLDAVEKLRGREFRMYWPKSGDAVDEHFSDSTPLPEYAHLYNSMPERWRQRRAEELLQALDDWRIACRRLEDELNLFDANRRVDDIADRIYRLLDQIEALPAYTIAGLRAKAQIVIEWNWEGRLPDAGPGYVPATLLAIVGDLMAVNS